MAIKFNEVLRPRPELLVIRQTRFEPTLKTLVGSGIIGMGIFFIQGDITIVTSLMFMEGLNWAARLVLPAFLLLVMLFGLALTFTGILQLIQPVEHQFDNRNKSYLRNNKLIARFDEVQDIFIRRRTKSSNGHTDTWYQLYLVLRSRKPIKLMKTTLGERAVELKEEMTSAIGLEPEQESEDTTEKRFLSWTYPPWLEWLMWPIIILFLVFWVDGFFNLDLLPMTWYHWIFGIFFIGIVFIIVGSNFGKITRTASKSDAYEIRKESQLSKKIKFISIIISILTIVFAIYLYFSSADEKKEKPVNTPSTRYDFSPLNEKFSFSSEKRIEEENEYISAGIRGGKYVVKLKETFVSGTFRASNPVTYCSECDITMETSKITGDEISGYGLYFGGQQIGMSFLINGSGQYALREFRGDSVFYNKSGDFEYSPHIIQGNGDNLLKVEYKLDQVVLWANDEKLETISINPSFRISRAGLVVDTISKSSSKNEYEVHFDNLRYFKPEHIK